MDGKIQKQSVSLTFLVILNSLIALTASTLAIQHPSIETGDHHDNNSLSLKYCNQSDLLQPKNVEEILELQLDTCNSSIIRNNNVIERFPNLLVLKISNTELGYLPNTTFNGLKRLRSLTLTGNNKTGIERWSKQPLIALETLNAPKNHIRQLQNNSFDCYPNLRNLDLSENDQETIQFIALPHLKKLNLAKNLLSSLNASAFSGLPRLTELNLSFNKLQSLESDVFEQNSYLRTLDLGYNRFQDLKFLEIKSLERLEALNISGNNLTELPANGFEHQIDLINLDLSGNLLQSLGNDRFNRLKSLEYLNLSRNHLDSIEPNAFSELSSLKEINFFGNNLRMIPMSLFARTPHLERINFGENKLEIINATFFSRLAHLTYINLAGNRLRNLAFTAHFSTAMQQSQLTLILRDNLLHENLVNFTKLAQFGRVELAGNHWSCSWLITTMDTLPKALHFEREYNLRRDNNSFHLNSFECYNKDGDDDDDDDDDEGKQRIAVLQLPCKVIRSHQHNEQSSCDNSTYQTELRQQSSNPSPPALVWPRIRMDKFDSRSVIIWMLIAIAIAFTGLRVARHLMDENDGSKLLRKLKHQQNNCTEMEILHPQDNIIISSTNTHPYGKLSKGQTAV